MNDKPNPKSINILRMIADGYSYEQICEKENIAPIEIYQAAKELLNYLSRGQDENKIGSRPQEPLKGRNLLDIEENDFSLAKDVYANDQIKNKKVSLDGKQPLHHGEPWSLENEEKLMKLYCAGQNPSKIAKQLGRSEPSVKAKLIEIRNDQVGTSRILGNDPVDGQVIELITGRFGPYVKHNGITATVPREIPNAGAISLYQAVELLNKKKGK